MASHLIAISGRKRSGKDTFAARLISHHGFTRVAFADPLKAVARDLDPIVDTYDDGAGAEAISLTEVLGPDDDWETAKELPEVRRILQVLGVAVRDHVDQQAWVNAALQRVEEIPGPAVITDCRFPNEAEAVRDWHNWTGKPPHHVLHWGRIVRINRPGLPDTDLHISETALDALVADYVVNNDAGLDKLYRQADEVAARVLAN